MNNAQKFDKSFLPPMMSVLNSDYWGTVMKTYEEKKHKETIYAVLDYIKDGLSKQSLDAEKTKYALPHGSIMVYLEIKEDSYSINAPFLKIPARSLIPLMRQAAEINFGKLVLAQIVVEGDDIYFRFDSPLELCDPYKLYRVLEEICIQADANDDVFIEKFGAQRFSQMQVVPFTDEQLDLSYTKFQEYLQEGLDYLAYFESKRIVHFGWDAMYLTFMKTDYFMRPQGVMKSDIEQGVKDLNSNAQLNEKLAKASSQIKKLQKLTKEKFAESMYQSQQFISEKPKFDISGVQNYLNKTHSTAQSEMNNKDYIGAALTMMTGFYGLIYYYNIPQTSYNMVIDGLEKTSDKPWETAANALWNALDQIMNQSQKTSNAHGLRDI